jgi:hypothetical protein
MRHRRKEEYWKNLRRRRKCERLGFQVTHVKWKLHKEKKIKCIIIS